MKVISGGQTGADQAGWRAAKAAGLETGGWMPKGFKAEDGCHPEFAELYGAQEHPSPAYPPRTRANVEWADVTLVFDISAGAVNFKNLSRGSQLTLEIAMELDRWSMVVVTRVDEPIGPERAPAIARWLADHDVRVLNIAGNRESKSPGIGDWVERYLTEVFRIINGGSK
jgi:hypothetical protein